MDRKIIGYFDISCEWNSFIPDETGNLKGSWNGKLAFYNDNFCAGAIADSSDNSTHLVLGTVVPATGLCLTKIHKNDERHAPITAECSTIAGGDGNHYYGRIYSVEFDDMKPLDLKGMSNMTLKLINLSEIEKLQEQAKVKECLESIENKAKTSKNKYAKHHKELVDLLLSEDQIQVTDDIDRRYYEFNGIQEPNPFDEHYEGESEEESSEYLSYLDDESEIDEDLPLSSILTNGGPLFNLAEEMYVKNKVKNKNSDSDNIQPDDEKFKTNS